MPPLPDRNYLPHAIPRWVNQRGHWFVTICTRPKGLNQLALTEIYKDIIQNLEIQQAMGRLNISSIVVMPDHIHLVAIWDHSFGIEKVVSLLKRFVSRKHKVNWQRDYFDHRIRHYGYFLEITEYIKMNPVRAGLVKLPGDWPYYMSYR